MPTQPKKSKNEKKIKIKIMEANVQEKKKEKWS